MEGTVKARTFMDTPAKTEQDDESCWTTPAWLLDRIRSLVGNIMLDPCTTSDNPTGAARIYAPPDDGILLPWDTDPIYCNPPYGYTIRHWVRKCIDAGKDRRKVLLLVPGRPDPKWFQDAWRASSECLFFSGRLRFGGAVMNAKFPSALLAFNQTLKPLADLGIIAEAWREL